MTVAEVNDQVDTFEATNQFGQFVQIPGRSWWLLFFFPYAFTGICSSELRTLRDLRADFDAANCHIAAVSCDTMFSLRVFADAENFGCHLITDHWPHGQLAQRFGVFDSNRGCAVRGSFLIDPEGVIRWKVVNGIGQPRDVRAHLAAVRELTGSPVDREPA